MTNKELVLKFYDEVFNKWDISNLDSYMKDDYIQHNPTAKDGNFVFVFFKCTVENGAINKVCDIYRLEDGKLAEHWDVVEHDVQNIVPVHNNGLF